MGAKVLGCGHACQLMEVDFMEEAPQVHIHFLTEPAEYEQLGYGKVELVCHGCGQSLLLYYNENDSAESKHLKVRNSFVRKHINCPNRKFDEHCPNYRATFAVKDLRPKLRSRKAKDGLRSIQDRTQ